MLAKILIANRGEIAVRVARACHYGARVVALSGREAGTVWNQLEILLSRWRSIEELLSTY